MRLYGPLVYRWCRRANLQETDAVDIGQDVFQAVFKAIDGFDHTIPGASFRGWLRRITINKIHDFNRRKQPGTEGEGGSEAQKKLSEIPEKLDVEVDHVPAHDGEDDGIVFNAAIELVLAEFSEKTRQAFIRLIVNRQAPEDVAKELGMTRNAVYLARSKVTRRLREELAGLEEFAGLNEK